MDSEPLKVLNVESSTNFNRQSVFTSQQVKRISYVTITSYDELMEDLMM